MRDEVTPIGRAERHRVDCKSAKTERPIDYLGSSHAVCIVQSCAMRVGVFLFFVFVLGCDLPDRVAKLEKESKELRAAQSDRDRIADYDLQAKCAKDARQVVQ